MELPCEFFAGYFYTVFGLRIYFITFKIVISAIKIGNSIFVVLKERLKWEKVICET